jgi:uncharacterized membrane protein
VLWIGLAAVVFLWSWTFIGHSFYKHRGSSDVGFYQAFGLQMRDGKVPYRDFAVEYPPGALPVFLAPTAVGNPSDLSDYSRWFGRLMGALGLCCLAIVAAVRRNVALAFIAISPLLIGSLAPTRFDFWPAALSVGAIVALMLDRHALGWGLLGAAFAAKLYPIVLVPLAAVLTLRRRGRAELGKGAAIAAIVVAAAFLPFAIVAPHGLWESLWGQISRPLEVESLAASFLQTFGHPEIVGAHGALAVAGHGTLQAVSTVLELGVLVVLWLGFARGEAEPDRFTRYAAACVCAFIAFGKVLSPQYLIWLVPLVALVRNRRGVAAVALLVAAFVCTDFIWYGSHRFDDYVFDRDWAWLMLTRNLILVVLIAVLAAPEPRLRPAAPEPRVAAG